MRFCSLGSGSRGNATLVEHGRTCLMIDCGFSAAEVTRRLERRGCRPERLTAILVTHEHTDHLRGIAVLARRHGLAVWASAGTAAYFGEPPGFPLHRFEPGRRFEIDDLEIHPFSVPHDAREPAQFVLGDGARRLGVLTDAGSTTAEMVRALDACDALLVECNHDPQMLAGGDYPILVKRRIASDRGHLSNGQAAALLGRIECGRLRHVVAAHLSAQNNTPAHAREALGTALGCAPEWIGIAGQSDGLDWRDVG
jgi:phosphoribosyl 1,2-cyclic phosphodiesterase